MDGTRGEGVWGEGEASAASTTEGIGWVPCRGKVGYEVGFEDKLKLVDGGERTMGCEWADEEGNGMGDGEVKAGRAGVHDDRAVEDRPAIKLMIDEIIRLGWMPGIWTVGVEVLLSIAYRQYIT